MPICPRCKREFTTKNGLKRHRLAKHVEDDEPSFASRAIEAQLDHAMGMDNPDYDWLVEPYL